MPGVAAVVTGRDVAQWTATLKMAPPIEGLLPTEMTTLPIDKVRFQGDLVACVVATDRYLAEDAAERIEVEYEPLGAVADAGAALAEGAPLVDESLPSNLLVPPDVLGGRRGGAAGRGPRGRRGALFAAPPDPYAD